MSDNPVVLRMRRIFCCKGADFAGPDLQAGWEEIERLEATITELEAAEDVAIWGEYTQGTIDDLRATIIEQAAELDWMTTNYPDIRAEYLGLLPIKEQNDE